MPHKEKIKKFEEMKVPVNQQLFDKSKEIRTLEQKFGNLEEK